MALVALAALTFGCGDVAGTSQAHRSATRTTEVTTTAGPALAPMTPSTATTAPQAPATRPAPVSAPSAVPPEGEATGAGCDVALAYLRTYADPIFGLRCPGDASGKAAITCFGGWSGAAACGPYEFLIVIADPCPIAYMNEASNSWVVAAEAGGASDPAKAKATLDPFGPSC